jgi:phage shock protein PspC (stress-responsive transcriptional regulator)
MRPHTDTGGIPVNDENPSIEQPEGDDKPTREEPARPSEPQSGRPRRLLRSSSDRVLTGVSGGLGRYFGVDPLLFRIGFVLSLFFGGLGGLAYALLALFVPTDGAPDFPQRLGGRLQRRGFWRGLAIVGVAALAVAGLFVLATGAAFAVAVGWGVPVAVGVIVVGVVLALTAFRGGAKWLIPPVMAIAIGAGVASAADLDFSGGIGERKYQPVTTTAIPAKGYKLGVGRLAVDLRGLDWNKARVVPLHVRLGTGQADVFVPENVCVTGSTHVGIGESEVAGERNDGVDVDHSPATGSSAVPRLELDAKVNIGQLRVINSNSASVAATGYGDHFDESAAPQRTAETRACANG